MLQNSTLDSEVKIYSLNKLIQTATKIGVSESQKIQNAEYWAVCVSLKVSKRYKEKKNGFELLKKYCKKGSVPGNG